MIGWLRCCLFGQSVARAVSWAGRRWQSRSPLSPAAVARPLAASPLSPSPPPPALPPCTPPRTPAPALLPPTPSSPPRISPSAALCIRFQAYLRVWAWWAARRWLGRCDGRIIMFMHPATNKPPQPSQRLSQPDLHAKILTLVAHRMQPTSPSLTLTRTACGSCVAASPATTKRNSLATLKSKHSHLNQAHCEGHSPHEKATATHVTRELLARQGQGRKLQIVSKVVGVSVEQGRVGDFTIDLRAEMPTEFVNVKLLSKLRADNAQKDRRIQQLEQEALELHERIIEMTLSIENNSKRSFPDFSLPSSIHRISDGNQHVPRDALSRENEEWKEGRAEWKEGRAEQKEGRTEQKEGRAGEKDEVGQDEHLLRMLQLQALEIERLQLSLKHPHPKRHSHL